MSTRDRLMLMGLAAIAVLGAAWILAVSPARQQASKLSGEVATARTQLEQAQTEADEARNARQRYRSAYASLTSLGMAVPTSPEVPALIYALDHAANSHKVEFSSITGSSAGPSGTAASSSSSSSPSSSGAAAQSSPFTQMPFTFVFNGTYHDLIHLLTQLEGFTVQSTGGSVRVSGRLLTIQSITLGSGGAAQSGQGSGAAQPAEQMSWTITASAYVLAPAAAGAPGSPAGAGSQAPTTPAASGGPSSPTTAAIVRTNG